MIVRPYEVELGVEWLTRDHRRQNQHRSRRHDNDRYPSIPFREPEPSHDSQIDDGEIQVCAAQRRPALAEYSG